MNLCARLGLRVVTSSILLSNLSLAATSRTCLQTLSDHARPHLEYGRTVAVNPEGQVYFKKSFFPSLVAQPYPVGKTHRFVSRRYLDEMGQWDPSSADAIALLLHGNGADYSHSGSMLGQLEVLSEVGFETDNPLAKRIGSLPHAVKIAAAAIDLPGHGLGPSAKDYWGLKATLENWLDPIIEDLLRHGKPVLIFARSGSCGLARSYAQRYPGKILLVSAMSPVLPHVAYEKSVSAFYDMVREKVFVPNFEGFMWVEAIHREMNGSLWDPRNGVAEPTIYFVGAKDRETPAEVRDALTQYGEFEGTRTMILPKAYHDVFSSNSPSNAAKAYALFYEYLSERKAAKALWK